MLMKPLKALWRAAQSQYPQQSSEATVSQSFYLIQAVRLSMEWTVTAFLRLILAQHSRHAMPPNYLSTFTSHHVVNPQPFWLVCHFFSMKWTFTSLDLSLFFPIAGSDYTILLGIVHPYPSLHIQTAFFFCCCYLTGMSSQKQINPYLFSATLSYTYVPVFSLS